MARRSQSYSDFHDAARAVLGQDTKKTRRASDVVERDTEIKTELDFIDWYYDLEHDMLDASHEEYT